MKQNKIRWAMIGREDVLDVLLGEHQPPDTDLRMEPDLAPRGAKLAVGYRGVQDREDYGGLPLIPVMLSMSTAGRDRELCGAPSLIVLPDETATEILSWLRTFADEVSPLSQYCRVVLASDWRRFEVQNERFFIREHRPDRWSSIVIGEALSQIEGETNLQNLPLSRFAGCFTTPIARTALIWGNDEATQTCTNRLRQLERDRRFARRPVGIEQLLPVWAIASAKIEENLDPSEAASYVLDAGFGYYMANDREYAPLASPLMLKEAHDLSSDSIEERVGAFNRLASNILQRAHSDRGLVQSALDSLLLAAAAFQVGRGTSHVFLLQRVQGFAPTAATWFGAMAALAGPRAWDKAWLQAAKGAERLLRSEFNWLDTSSADIGWVEFAWMAGTFGGLDVFLDLPKMLPRTLGIEIVPGAVGQFRLAGESAENEPKPQQARQHLASERALMETVAQLITLAQRAKEQIDPSFLASVAQPVQKSFGFDGDTGANKSPRTKRSKRDTNNS